MRRRTLLTALAAVAGTAGCIQDGTAPADLSTEEEPRDGTPTDTRTDTRTVTDQGPSPDPATDVFADFDCPSFTDNADRTVCYHRTDPAETDSLLTADPEVFDPTPTDGDAETLHFTLWNRSDRPVGLNPYAWGIERHDGDGEWSHVAPEAYPEPWTRVKPGATMQWVLPSENRGESPDEAHSLTVALEPGVYAFHVVVYYEGDADTPTGEAKSSERVELVALFRVEERVDPGSEGTSNRPTETGSS